MTGRSNRLHITGRQGLGMVEGGRKFSCNKCGAIFASLERLVEQNRTHVLRSTVGMFTCTVCGTKLGDRVKLLEHVRRAHGM